MLVLNRPSAYEGCNHSASQYIIVWIPALHYLFLLAHVVALPPKGGAVPAPAGAGLPAAPPLPQPVGEPVLPPELPELPLSSKSCSVLVLSGERDNNRDGCVVTFMNQFN